MKKQPFLPIFLFTILFCFPCMHAYAQDSWEAAGGPSVADDIEEAREEEKAREDLTGRDLYLLEKYPTPEDYHRIAPNSGSEEAYTVEQELIRARQEAAAMAENEP